MSTSNVSVDNTRQDAIVDLGSRLFALIIGINDYPEVKKLKGAVADARSIAVHLREELNIPADYITEIYNEKATRDSIVEKIQGLGQDERIIEGDAILIFFAGHGCEMDAPVGWDTSGQKIQGLVPFDVKTLNIHGRPVEPIPDRTFGYLLEELASSKGDNITVILDCCHSTGGTREFEESQTKIARLIEAEELPPLSEDTDWDIISKQNAMPRPSIIPTGFTRSGLRSHVLLAACGSKEVAWEHEGQGAFTAAILPILKEAGSNNLTYTELMGRLPKLSPQNPQCEGEHKNRILFNNVLAGGSADMVRVDIQDGTLKLHAGYVQGVTKGALFDIYQRHVHDSSSNPRLATLQVISTQEFYSVLSDEASLNLIPDKPAYACQARSGQGHDLQVYVSAPLHRRLKGDKLWRENFLSQNSGFGARPTSNLADAHLYLDLGGNDEVTFETRHTLSTKHGITRLPHTVSVNSEEILSVLSAAAAWMWHIDRKNDDHPIGDQVTIEFFRVKEDLNQWNDENRRPLILEGDNLNESGVVDIVANPNHLYGYKIVNRTAWKLYPYVFYFDACNLEIQPYYLGAVPGGGNIDVPLPPHGELAIGYGPSGEIPKAYSLGEGQMREVGVIKMFVSTMQIDFGMLEQESPFEDGRGSDRKVVVNMRLANRALWDTQQMVLILHKSEAKPVPSSKASGLKAPLPPAAPTAALVESRVSGQYGLWVVFPAALMLSFIPFILFYLFIL